MQAIIFNHRIPSKSGLQSSPFDATGKPILSIDFLSAPSAIWYIEIGFSLMIEKDSGVENTARVYYPFRFPQDATTTNPAMLNRLATLLQDR